MRVLIAEDDVISSKILQKNLLDWGYEVVLARRGEKAWQALQDPALRLAILDWMMPGMDGPEICARIRRRKKYQYTYIILLSAKDRKRDIIAGLSSGADDYMTKPVNYLELRARLRTGQAHHRPRGQADLHPETAQGPGQPRQPDPALEQGRDSPVSRRGSPTGAVGRASRSGSS